jgi:hypothetical protein
LSFAGGFYSQLQFLSRQANRLTTHFLFFGSYPEFVLQVLDGFPKIALKDRNDKAKILLYCMYLLQFKAAAGSKRGTPRSKIEESLAVRCVCEGGFCVSGSESNLARNPIFLYVVVPGSYQKSHA